MNHVVSIDVGSASVRAGVFTVSGIKLAQASATIQIFKPYVGYVEQSALNIWQQSCLAVRQAVTESGVDIGSIKAIAFDATCSLVALDRDDNPLSISPTQNQQQTVIMWMDHRAIAETEEINASGDEVLRYAGGKLSPEMQVPKVLWLKRHLPEVYQRADKFLDLADFMVYRASGEDVRSVCTQVCKWTYLAHEQSWGADFFRQLGLTDIFAANRLGKTIGQLGEAAGVLQAEAANQMGLLPGITVSVGIIDAHAGGLGVFGDQPEAALALIGGTSSCHMAVSKQPRFVEGIWGPYFGAMIPGMWLNEGGQSASGALIDHVIKDSAAYAELLVTAQAESKTVYQILNKEVLRLEAIEGEITQDVHMLGYYNGNRSPRADPLLKGMLTGLSLDESISALARIYLAAIQSVAYGTRHIIEQLNVKDYQITNIHMCGGGIKNPLWLREHADITGCRIVLPKDNDAVLLGTAMLAATAAGFYPSLTSAMTKMSAVGEICTPQAKRSHFHQKKYAVFLELFNDQIKYHQIMNQ